MADIRINSLPSTATSFNTDDYIAIDGASGGTRKMLAATLPLTDVTLGGSSGPSVKSSLSARAPRQGLVFDGTAGATISIASLGTAFTVHLLSNPTTISSNLGVLRATGTLAGNLYFNTSGAPGIYNGSGYLTAASTGTVNKSDVWTYVLSAGTGTWYKNGVSVSTHTDAGTYPDSITGFGIDANSFKYSGTLSGLIYNRALSASEVVSLYEAGAPAGADYGSSSNAPSTNAITNAARNSTFTAGATDWAGGSGGSVTSGGAFTITPTNLSRVELANGFNTIRSGIRYRISVTVTGFTAGTDPVVLRGSLIGGTNVTINGNGTFTVPDFTSNTSTAYLQFINLTGTGSGSNCTFTVTSIVVTTLGLLLAPDAAQAGGGLVWYDTSGNAANITLPASGVSWNVPSSLKTASGWTFGGSTIVSVDNSNGSQDNYPQFFVQGATDSTKKIRLGYDTTNGYGFIQPLQVGVGYKPLVLNQSGGNVLIGKTTPDTGEKLQVSGSGRFSGNVHNSNTFGFISYGPNGSDTGARIWCFSDGAAYIDAGATTGASAGQLVLRTGGGLLTALTLDSSQNILTSTNGIIYTNRVYNLTGGATPLTIGWTGSAGIISVFSSGDTTFAGTGRFNGAASGAVLNLKETAGVPTALNLTNRNSTQTWSVAVDAAAVDDKLLAFIESGAVKASLAATSGNATFTGTVNTQGGTASTPASASATGTAGTIQWDASYIYVCTAANTWKRVAIATW